MSGFTSCGDGNSVPRNFLCNKHPFFGMIEKNGYFVKEALFYFVLFYKEVSDNLMSFSQERQKIFRTTFLIHSPSGDTKGFIL